MEEVRNDTVSQDDIEAIKWALEWANKNAPDVYIGLHREYYLGVDMFLCTVTIGLLYAHAKTYAECIKVLRDRLETAVD